MFQENKLYFLFNDVDTNLILKSIDATQLTFLDEKTAITTSTLDQIQPLNDCELQHIFWDYNSIDGAITQNSFSVKVNPQEANDSFTHVIACLNEYKNGSDGGWTNKRWKY